MQNLVLVMYKNKVLLSASDMPMQKNEWNFIKKSTIRINSSIFKNNYIENSARQMVYYVKLTDENVNSLTRRNGQRLEFYSLTEIEKLSLSKQAALLFTEFKHEMVRLLSDQQKGL